MGGIDYIRLAARDLPIEIVPLYLDPDVRVGQRIAYRVTAVDGWVPPNESLGSDHLAACDLDDRLVHQKQFVLGDGVVKCLLQFVPRRQLAS